MKKLLYILAGTIVLSSCKKNEPVNSPQIITYGVVCEDCQVSYVDGKNTTQLQHVKGQWQLNLTATGLPVASMEIYRTVGFENINHVNANIMIDGKSSVQLNGNISPGDNRSIRCSATL